MDTSKTPFTAMYARWAQSFQQYYFGTGHPAEPTPGQEQAAAQQEWEHEGGSVKPAATPPHAEAAPKLPL